MTIQINHNVQRPTLKSYTKDLEMCRTTDLSAKSCWNNCNVVVSVLFYEKLGLSASDLGTELSHKPSGNPAL